VEVDCMPVADGDARLIVYRPVGRLAFVGNRALADIALAASRGDSLDDLSASQSEAVDFLRSIGFLEPDPDAPSPPAGGFTPTTAVLLLTNRCQLRCTYCYASAGELPRAQLSVALGRAAIERVAEFALALGRPGSRLPSMAVANLLWPGGPSRRVPTTLAGSRFERM